MPFSSSLRRLGLAVLVVSGMSLVSSGPASAAQFASIAPGLNHTCATKTDGTAWCWGEGRQGQVGVIGAVRPRTPIYVIGSYQTIGISSGQAFWCGLMRDGTTACTGRGTRGQIGNGSLSTAQFPQEVALTGVTDVSAGVATACAVHNGGLVSCWGEGIRGQLGNGLLQQDAVTTPFTVPGLDRIVNVDVGDSHVCAVRSDGLVLCWGDTDDGKLGNGINSAITVPEVPVTGLTGATAVAVGDRHSCALRRDGTVACWGDNTNGQLGLGPEGPPSAASATTVPALRGVVQLAASGLTTCAVKRDGTAVCWGDGTSGQIGNGVRGNAVSPQQVSDISDAAQIGVGSQHACLVTRTQVPYCWGRNSSGQLGTGGPLSQVALKPQLVQDFVLGPVTFLTAEVTGVPAGSTAGGVVQFNAMRLSRKRGRTCPKQATVRITARGRTAVRRAPVTKTGGGCELTGRFLLPNNSQNATRATYRITGANLKTKSQKLKPREL